MADRERRGLVARWLEGKERSEDYARSTLPSNRWQLFWDIMKGRFGRLMLVNLLTLITFVPLILVYFWRYLVMAAQFLQSGCLWETRQEHCQRKSRQRYRRRRLGYRPYYP